MQHFVTGYDATLNTKTKQSWKFSLVLPDQLFTLLVTHFSIDLNIYNQTVFTDLIAKTPMKLKVHHIHIF